MALEFEYVVNLTDNATNMPPLIGSKASIVHTLDGTLNNYYLNGKIAETKTFMPVNHPNDYANLTCEGKTLKLTARAVSDLEIKTFPGIGPYGFFTYAYENTSRVIIPVDKDYDKYSPAVVQMSEGADTLGFTIIPPEDIEYSCYRLILRNGAFAFEYITYETTIVVPKPTVNGMYTIFCIGYVNEGSSVSYDSNVISYEVTTGQDTFEPSSDLSYFTKEQIITLLSALESRLDTVEQEVGAAESLVDTINGEVI